MNIILEFIDEALKQIPQLDTQTENQTAKDKFQAQFNLERLIDILENTPIQKNFLKDNISQLNGG